jgi:SAM-dependent methyltransferase
VFICPACNADLYLDQTPLVCSSCRRTYAREKGIPLLFWPGNQVNQGDDVTTRVKAFYERTPFPNYDDLDTAERLKEKARRNVFAHLLHEQIPREARVLEAGCGTGQLSNLLALETGRAVFGADLCLNSLKLGQGFKDRNHIDNVTYVQMNLFRPVFRPESFDVVISSGVLHHTSNPSLGFQTLSRLLKPGGYIVIGLYHAYGRVATNLRRLIFKLTGDRLKFLDARLRSRTLSAMKKETWFLDQYKNPHESQHTIREVSRWFDACGIRFVISIPNAQGFRILSEGESLFADGRRPAAWSDHVRSDLVALLKGRSEGGFFIMIGRKPA